MVSDSDDVLCRTLRTDELEVNDSPTGDYFSVRNAGNPIAAFVSESTAEEMLKLARRHTHQCVIGLGTDYPVTYWYGDSGAQVAPASPDQCLSYVPQNLDFVLTKDGGFTIGTAEAGVMLRLDSREIAERAFALAKDHRQLCFLGFDGYRRHRLRRIDDVLDDVLARVAFLRGANGRSAVPKDDLRFDEYAGTKSSSRVRKSNSCEYRAHSPTLHNSVTLLTSGRPKKDESEETTRPSLIQEITKQS